MTTATDDAELLDVLDREGRSTGLAKRRDEVHRDGDWHLCVFVWIVRVTARGPEIVLQRRASTKATWPGRFDASTAGHVRSGESRAAALREVEEELGVRVHEDELVPLPPHAEEHRFEDGRVDREHHDVSLVRRDGPLEAYRPSPAEVAGLVAVPAPALADLAAGRVERVAELVLVQRAESGDVRLTPCALERADLVPYRDGYVERVCASAVALVDAARAPGG